MARKILMKNLHKHITSEMEEKYFNTFGKQARYLGNGVYSISGVYSTDTRELFLMYCAIREGIQFEKE